MSMMVQECDGCGSIIDLRSKDSIYNVQGNNFCIDCYHPIICPTCSMSDEVKELLDVDRLESSHPSSTREVDADG